MLAMSGLNKSPRALALGSDLAEARIKSGLNQREAAQRFGFTQAVIARIETGRRVPTPDECAVLLGIYSTPLAEREHILELARDVDRETWTPVGSRHVPRQLGALVKYEAAATAICEVNPLVIPGLLQTFEYAQAVMSADRLSPSEIDARVMFRMNRQKVLRGEEPSNYLAIIDELALMRFAGDSSIMKNQYARLLEWLDFDHIDIRIVPRSTGFYPSLAGGYVVLEFDDGPPVVHVEHMGQGTWLHQAKYTKPLLSARSSTLKIALDSDSSRDLIAAYEKGESNGKAPVA
ncbi:DNA binding protein with helix-turn-helix domain [Actinoalloteichus hymeniacidonis]|uniref:DNA binding protein with helix-turn-helix domain n=1 Tax=Actinoalloteichus hymeniacidonis TaxID=340345 RepID=A0AAC9HT38_9PSEU|nr:DNA binding protein with helix-turn-helix domain [Actinoalloteichus hymeniacidonis]